ncbi:MAG: dynamin family protein [Peptococcaceae bacterium]|nr:dynamin family protein [Peptococcaceae bacterium]
MNNTVAEYISRVRDLCALDPERKNPVIFIAGPVNSGKSTLVNNLLEQRICPDDASPSTLFPVYFGYSETPSAFKTAGGRAIRLHGRELREIFRNRRRSSLPERADVFLPSGILRWCSLADTPGTGLSGDVDDLVMNCLSRADGIVFLFHQRGIDAAAHSFLTRLAAAGTRGWISFWINANLGLIDGTSLTETGRVLRTIFPGQAEVHAINAKDPHSIGLLSLYLQVRVLESAVRGIEAGLSRRDRLIPSLVERASLVKDDDRFLIKFWEVLDEAGTINAGRQAIRDLPLIRGSIAGMLRANTLSLTAGPAAAAVLHKESRTGPGPGERLASLIGQIRSDRDLARYVDGDLLKKAADRLGEKCRVIVAGPFSTGKTTFLNALLGETLLPAEDRATTSCAVRLGYGPEKLAAVEFLYRAEFYPVNFRDGKLIPDRQEMLAITQILDSPPLRELVSECRVCRDGLYKSVPLSDLGDILDEIFRCCGMDSGLGGHLGKTRRVPLFPRRAAALSPAGPAVTGVSFTLARRDRMVFRLDDDRRRLEFYRVISPPGSYLVDSVTISYPSPNLSLADFIDTPGLDSVHKRHQDRAAGILASADLALVFLHARHVLAGSVPGQAGAVRKPALNTPVIYVINFADTVSETDREKVSLYIRQKLGRDAGSKEIIPYPQVYTISALNALHRGDEGFDRLMRRVRKKTWETEARKVNGAAGEIKAWMEKITGPAGIKNMPERARQAALYYLGEIERLQKTYF